MKKVIIETQRLFLRLYENPDKSEFIKLLTDETVMKHVGDGVLRDADAEKLWEKLTEDLYAQNIDTIWAVFEKEGENYIGSASIRPRPEKKEDWEIVYILKRRAWGKGYATEIAKRLIEFGFADLNLPEVFATVDEDNTSSINVLTKAGMKFSRYNYDEQGRFAVYSSKLL